MNWKTTDLFSGEDLFEFIYLKYDRLKASGKFKKKSVKRSKGKKLVQDGQSNVKSSDSEFKLNPILVHKPKKSKPNPGKQNQKDIDSNMQSGYSNDEDYNSENEENAVQECISLPEQVNLTIQHFWEKFPKMTR